MASPAPPSGPARPSGRAPRGVRLELAVLLAATLVPNAWFAIRWLAAALGG